MDGCNNINAGAWETGVQWVACSLTPSVLGFRLRPLPPLCALRSKGNFRFLCIADGTPCLRCSPTLCPTLSAIGSWMVDDDAVRGACRNESHFSNLSSQTKCCLHKLAFDRAGIITAWQLREAGVNHWNHCPGLHLEAWRTYCVLLSRTHAPLSHSLWLLFIKVLPWGDIITYSQRLISLSACC